MKTLSATTYVVPAIYDGIRLTARGTPAEAWIPVTSTGMTIDMFGALFTPSMEQRA
jgi:hypothetical protein